MKSSEIVSFLRSLGLSDYESKAYLTLVSLGPSKAIRISFESGIPQSKIYTILESLIEKNLVEVYTGRPKKYKAVEPNIALKNIVKSKEIEIKKIKAKAITVERVLSSLTKKPALITGIWSIKTNKWMEFFNKVAEMLNRSNNYVYAITRDYSKTSRLIQAAQAAIKRGVKIKVIGMEPPREDNILKIKIYQKAGVELKYLSESTTFHPRIVVIDGKEVILRLDLDPTKRDGFLFNAIWTEEPSIVMVFDNYLKSLWEKAIPIDLSMFKF